MNIATHYPWPNNITKTISQKPETIGITYTTDSEETDSESDCGYEGGVDCDPSDDSAADSDEDWLDDESLAELEGDELEANTFDTLKENMPKALASMELQTIWQWEHQMFRWMDAYRGGMGTTDAQKQVKAFSSTKYKSHRRVLEAVARTFDQ